MAGYGYLHSHQGTLSMLEIPRWVLTGILNYGTKLRSEVLLIRDSHAVIIG